MIKLQITAGEMKLTSGFLFALRKLKGNISQECCNQKDSKSNLYIRTNIPEVVHLSISLSNQTVISKNSVAKPKYKINTIKSSVLLGKDMLDPISGVAKRAVDRLIENPEKAFRYGRYFFLLIKVILTPFKQMAVGSKI